MVSHKRTGEGGAIPLDIGGMKQIQSGYIFGKWGQQGDLILGKHSNENNFNFVVVL